MLFLGVSSVLGCGGSPSSRPDAGSDTGSKGGGGGSGSGGGAGSDASTTDLRGDTASDARSDAGGDQASGDVRADGTPDVRAEGGIDGGGDVPAPGDGGADARSDAGGDTNPPPDGGADLPADLGGDSTGGSLDAGPPESYVAALTGAEQVPPVGTAASGSATLSYDPATHVLSWTLTHSIAAATGAHIHTGGGGETGIAATATLGVATSTTGSAMLEPLQEADLRLGHLYLDVHSSSAPDGEIRGQILRPGETLWVARLTGAEEVPSNHSAGTAAMSLIVNSAHSSAHYRLLATSLVPTGGHIHTGVAGVAGAIFTTFTFVGATSEADVAIAAADFSALDQTQLYANVHSALFTNGEIRGQLLRAGSSFFVSRMTGDQEVPAVSSTGTGSASVAVDYRSTTVRYAVSTSLVPTMAHIHPGIAGVANSPILTFTNLGATFAGTGTLTQPQLDALVAGRLYTNIHTAASPGGEIRGQLLRPGERLFAAALSGANEVPPVSSAATGAMQLILDAAATSLRYESAVTGLGDATSAFLVNGPAGTAGGTPVATLTLVGINPIGTRAVTSTDVTNLQTSMYYVDVHSSLHPEGEIRGQIVPR